MLLDFDERDENGNIPDGLPVTPPPLQTRSFNVGEPTLRYSRPPSMKNELLSTGDIEAEPEENLSKVLGMS